MVGIHRWSWRGVQGRGRGYTSCGIAERPRKGVGCLFRPALRCVWLRGHRPVAGPSVGMDAVMAPLRLLLGAGAGVGEDHEETRVEEPRKTTRCSVIVALLRAPRGFAVLSSEGREVGLITESLSVCGHPSKCLRLLNS